MNTPVAEECTPFVYRVRVPVPLPLRYVNCYLVRGANGWAVVDTGMRHAPAEAVWAQALAELDLTWSRINAIVVTHYHPDHYGAAGWMQDLTGAAVLMSPEGIHSVERIWQVDMDTAANGLKHLFLQHGMPIAMLQQMMELVNTQLGQTLPHPTLTEIDLAVPLRLGDILWRPIDAPGHADGQICLYDEHDQVLLAADHVLPKITPNVSVWPESAPNPLAIYFESLARIAQLPTRLVLPGHRDPWDDLAGRSAEIRQHHAERLELMARLAGTGRNAYAISAEVFPLLDLTPHQVRFAMAETLAHLVYLESIGRLQSQQRDGVTVFIDQLNNVG